VSIHRILDFEALLFVYALAAIVVWKLFTAKINTSGLIMDKTRPNRVSPERVQLLISTLIICSGLIRNISISAHEPIPQVGSGWVALFGGSSAIYSVRKIFERFNKQVKK